mgnify:CR=1 FL=1
MNHLNQGLDTETYNQKRKQSIVDALSNNTNMALQREGMFNALGMNSDLDANLYNNIGIYQTNGSVDDDRILNEQMAVNDRKEGYRKSKGNYFDKELWIGDSKYKVESYRDWGKNSWRLTQIDPETGDDIDTRPNRKKLQLTDEDMDKIFTENETHGYLQDNGIFRQRYNVIDDGIIDREFFYDPNNTRSISDWRTDHPHEVPLFKKGQPIKYINDKGHFVNGYVSNYYLNNGNPSYKVTNPNDYGSSSEFLDYSKTPHYDGSDYVFPLTQGQLNEYETNGYPIALGRFINYSIPKNLSKENYQEYLNKYESEMKKEGYSEYLINQTINSLKSKFNNALELSEEATTETQSQPTVVSEEPQQDSTATETVVTDSIPPKQKTTKNTNAKENTTNAEAVQNNEDDDEFMGFTSKRIKQSGGVSNELYDNHNKRRRENVIGLWNAANQLSYGIGNGINNFINDYNNDFNWSFRLNNNPNYNDEQNQTVNTFNNLDAKYRNPYMMLGALASIDNIGNLGILPKYEKVEEQKESEDVQRLGGQKYQSDGEVQISRDPLFIPAQQDALYTRESYNGRKPMMHILDNMYMPSLNMATRFGNLLNETDYSKYKQYQDYSQLADTFEEYLGYNMNPVNSVGDFNTHVNGRRMSYTPNQEIYV